ncbi:MAG: hypothetical protein V1717_00100 [Candidatus Micrarchaeota archaeon]
MAGDDKKTIGAIFLLLGIAWLLGKLNVGLSADILSWLVTVIALLGGLYLLFM